MSKRTSVGSTSSRWRRLIAVAAVLMLVAGMSRFGPGSAVAQDATPMMAGCVSPGFPPGTPEPPPASPEASMDDMDMGTPAAMEAAVAPEAPGGTPADEATAEAISSAVENYVGCVVEAGASGDYLPVAALETTNFWMEDSGDTNPYNRAVSWAENGVASAEILQISNQQTYDDGSVSADVQLLINDLWGVGFRWYFVQDGDLWKVNTETQLSAEAAADTVSTKGLSVTEAVDDAGAKTYTFTWAGASEIPQTEAILFNLSSAASNTEVHEFIFVKIPDGADPAGLLDGSIPEDQQQFLGGAFGVYPGQFIDVAFYNLQAGTYAVLCFFTGPDGLPHAMDGMITSFTVVTP